MTTLAPITAERFAAFLADAVPGYADDKVRAGSWIPDDALERSRRGYAELLPDGPDTRGHHVFEVRDDDGRDIGVLWFAEVQRDSGARIAWVYDISIDPEHRRRGHATRAFAMLEQMAREMGLRGIGLHVFGHNEGAYQLYRQLGFRTTDITMHATFDEPA